MKTITGANYAGDLALLSNTHEQTKLPHLEQAVKGIGLFVNSDKTTFMCFKQDFAITLNDKLPKLVVPLTYILNDITSSKSDAFPMCM